jgi:hypothetical protein
MEFPNIKYNGDVSKFVEAKDDPDDFIFLNKDSEYFQDENSYVKFVKDCEKVIRTSPDYSVFVRFIKDVLGINFCQVSSKIYDTDATIEMHHGPIFTLYDITSIVLNDFLRTNRKINTGRIANQVLEEHFDLKVQVVMLAVTNHEAAHNRDLFLHVNQGIGDLNGFILKYQNSLDDIHKYKIWNYINMCKNNPSFDRGYLDVDHISKIIKL